MKKNLLSVVAFMGICGLNAQTYVDITPASFVQGIDNNCSSANGDLNGDGKPDIILTGRENSSGLHKTWIYLNDGAGEFTLSTNSGITMGLKHSSVNLGDYDGDGDLDIVMQGWDWNATAQVSTQRAYVYQNDGTGIFTLAASLDGRSNGTIEFGDYDNDGKMDILQTGWKANISNGKTTIYHNDGANVFTDINNTTVFNLADGEARFGDYDNDGKLDIIVNGWMQSHIYKGDGAGNFINQNIALPAYDWSYVNWIDYNKDGFKDILIGGHYYNNADYYETKVFKGNGTNSFTEVNLGLTNVQRGPIKLGDCNNDDKIDFFISGWAGSGVFQIYKNDGTNNAFSSVAGINDLISGWADGTMEVADFNGNGNADIFKCGWTKTKLYSNTEISTSTKTEASGSESFSTYIENNILNINMASESHKNHVKLYDSLGKLISQHWFVEKNAAINLPPLEKGCYIVYVQNETITKSAVVIVK